MTSNSENDYAEVRFLKNRGLTEEILCIRAYHFGILSASYWTNQDALPTPHGLWKIIYGVPLAVFTEQHEQLKLLKESIQLYIDFIDWLYYSGAMEEEANS